MIRSMLVAILLLATGCSSPGTLRRHESTALAPLLASRPTLRRFLVDVRREIEEHDWHALLARAERRHYRAQVDRLGMREAQYVAELLGLNMADNNLRRAGERGPIQTAWLNRIKRVHYRSHGSEGPFIVVRGQVWLADGRRLTLTLMLRHDGRRWALSGAVG